MKIMQNRKEQHADQIGVEEYLELASVPNTLETVKKIVGEKLAQPVESIEDFVDQMNAEFKQQMVEQAEANAKHALDHHSGDAQDALLIKRCVAVGALRGLFSAEARARKAAELHTSCDSSTEEVSSLESSPVSTPRL